MILTTLIPIGHTDHIINPKMLKSVYLLNNFQLHYTVVILISKQYQ